MQRFLGIILFFIFIVGCRSDRPNNILKEKEMTDLLVDLHLAEAYTYSGASDSLSIKAANFVESIYHHYKTDSATVRESIEYYAKHPQILNRIYLDVDKRLKQMETSIREVEDKKAREIFVKDSIRNAIVTDSLLKIRKDSLKYATFKYLLFWKNPDSTTLKSKPWEWKKELLPPRRYFNYPDSMFYLDSVIKKDSIILKKDKVLPKSKPLELQRTK